MAGTRNIVGLLVVAVLIATQLTASPAAADVVDDLVDATAATAAEQAEAVRQEALGLPTAPFTCSLSLAEAASAPGTPAGTAARDLAAGTGTCASTTPAFPSQPFSAFLEWTLEAWDPATRTWGESLTTRECQQSAVVGVAAMPTCTAEYVHASGDTAVQRVRRWTLRAGTVDSGQRRVWATRFTAPLPPHLFDMAPQCTVTAPVTLGTNTLDVPPVYVYGRVLAVAAIRCLSAPTASYRVSGTMTVETCDPATRQWTTRHFSAFVRSATGPTATVLTYDDAVVDRAVAGWRITWRLTAPNSHSASSTSPGATCL